MQTFLHTNKIKKLNADSVFFIGKDTEGIYFVNSMRIEMKAKQLLKEKVRNFTIEEIAQESGFNSVSTFHRAFLKYTGKTPNDFRKSNDK